MQAIYHRLQNLTSAFFEHFKGANPVEAKIAKNPEAYPRSSYRAFTGLQSIPDWLETQAVLDMVSQKQTLNTYKSYVEEGLDDATISFYEKTSYEPRL